MYTHIKRLSQLQIVRRMGGAVMGSAVALLLYGAYGLASDAMKAYLPAEAERAVVADDENPVQNEEAFMRIGELARRNLGEVD